MLCLMTYADVGAVSPETLTPWKAESLWQLYAATANHMLRSVDSERLESAADERTVQDRVVAVAPGLDAEQVRTFLHGMPRRYVLLHSPEEIAGETRLDLATVEKWVRPRDA